MPKRKPAMADLDAVLFDFDGVLTDNRVYVDEDGKETVACNRSDGLAFEALRATPLKLFILSREKNKVVSTRAAKLQIPCIQSSLDKLSACKSLCEEKGFAMGRLLFVGNDLNDYHVMRACGFSACPSDSHPAVKRIATFKLARRGGEGIALEIAEKILGLNVLDYLEKKKRTPHA